MREVLGIDVGATGIKGAIVDMDSGTLINERHKIATPEGGKPEDILATMKELIDHFQWSGKPVGVGFPSIVKDGHTHLATNIAQEWIGYPINAAMSDYFGVPISAINDADAAGLAEITFGKGKGVMGTVILLTLGTGVGSAIFKDGKLLLNTELGQMMYKGYKAEKLVANSARKREDMTWEEYGEALGGYLRYVDGLFSPNLILIGGGISKKLEKYSAAFSDLKNILPAAQLNDAGIVGAALASDI